MKFAGRLAAVGVVATALVGGALQPAFAAETPLGTADASGVVEQLAPGILGETSHDAGVSVAETPATEGISVAVGSDEAISELDDASSPGITFSVDYATKQVGTDSGLQILETTSENASAYVQPLASGVRVLTAIESAEAPSEYSYSFDVPAETVLNEGANGYYLESGEDVLGVLAHPWAVDADGQQLPTSFTWESGKLTQHVDLSSPAIAFPVLADPAWSYTYSYATKKTAAANKNLLKGCFSCYFPVSGAPKAFPKAGQLLPLRVGPGNFECRFKSEFSGTNYFGFQFDATKNHVDGAGSNIVFEFRTVGGVKKLVVSGYIVNDAWWVKNNAYKVGALNNWQTFANRLNAA
ncbi:hypothetical protein [Frigoribacterium sp. CFBP 13712]|uniref:hypothetical protein n=1 Tax=Frigoribacterium sp. CFBP 13712 TaxID=2775309 RepID=UPI0017829162|nr:hypothetical protein [Frigoribacterium sp. CFBP 13712]MBD8704920.1 hypothetical protein [Frigoribacterium sp. CFBP 13712]